MIINKKILIGVLIAVILISGLIIGWVILQRGKISPEKEIVTEKEETTKELLERLTPEEARPLTEEEREEQGKLLNQLTPTEPKSVTEEEQRELEELLKQLTP